MKISYLRIRNFKSIRDLEINELENALILVGKNNTGKTNVIDAILTATGNHIPKTTEFLDPQKSIENYSVSGIYRGGSALLSESWYREQAPGLR